jgi:hypothetical protein
MRASIVRVSVRWSLVEHFDVDNRLIYCRGTALKRMLRENGA